MSKIFSNLQNFIEKHLDYERIKKPSTYNIFDTSINEKLSYENFVKLKKTYGDITVGRSISNNDNRIAFERNNWNELDDLTNSISKIKSLNLRCVGLYWYPPNSYNGWHTNSNNSGDMIFYVYSPNSKSSFFRYINDDEMITEYDKKGWSEKKFHAGDGENLLWHCVGSYTNRFSIGFQVRPNKKTNLSII